MLNEQNISQTEISPSVKSIINLLSKTIELEIIKMSNSDCIAAGSIHIMKSPKTSHLKELNFSNIHIKEGVALQFVNFFQTNKHSKKLDLSNKNFTCKFINEIAVAVLNNNVIEDPNLTKNAKTGR